MTVAAGNSCVGMPPTVVGGGSVPAAVPGAAGQPASLEQVVAQLDVVVTQLEQLVAQMTPAGSVAGAQAGASELGTEPVVGGGAPAASVAPVAGACAMQDPAQAPVQSPTQSVTQAPVTSVPQSGAPDAGQRTQPASHAGHAGHAGHTGRGRKRRGQQSATTPPAAPTGAGSADQAPPPTAGTRTRRTEAVRAFDIPRANPRSPQEAIAWARAQAEHSTKNWYNLCLNFVAQTYGWSHSGVDTAIHHYSTVPASMRHDKDRNPPPGSLVYWDTGSGRAGHVALYLGNGQIASNDIVSKGKISIVPMSDIEDKWGAEYVGWTPPYFPKGS